MVIMTRAAVWKQKEQKADEKQLEEKCGVTSNPLMKEGQRTEAKDNDPLMKEEQ